LTKFFPDYCGVEGRNGWRFGRPVLQLTADHMTTPARKQKQLAQATITVASPKTLKTGQHFDLGIFDDLINDQNYRSKVLLKKAQDDFDMCFPLIDPGCPRFVTGTRYAFGDLYEVLQRRAKDEAGKDRGEWNISVKTCWNVDDDGKLCESRPVRFPRFIGKDGNAHGFTAELLNQIMRDNPGMFASQYLNQPMLESQQILTERDMLNATVVPAMAPPLGPAFMFIDLAAEGDNDPDDHVCIIGKTDGRGNVYAVGGNGGKWSIAGLANNVVNFALQCRPLKILIEETASAKYFVEYVRMVCRDRNLMLPLDYIKINNQKGAKETRIKAMAGHVKNGRLKFLVGLPYWDRLVEQSTKYNGSKHNHDDYPDTMALMMNVFSGQYLSLPPMSMRMTNHPVVAIMERDVAMNSPAQQDETYFGETMGSEFA
jgi:predicted phage terminase large subunit-like protein